MRGDETTATLIMTTVGRIQLTGTEDLVGIQGQNSEMLLTATEFEELGRRYAEWKRTRNDPPEVISDEVSPRACPVCAEGRMIMKRNGLACNACDYGFHY